MKNFKNFLEEHWEKDAHHRNGFDVHKHESHEKEEEHLNSISDKLHNNTAAGLTHNDHKIIRRYTGVSGLGTSFSTSLNKNLIQDKALTPRHKEIHETIKKHAKAAGHEVHLYSGTDQDFSKLAEKSKDGILHSKAHISATHDPGIAKDFAGSSDQSNPNIMHVIHIHVKPHNKILHVSKISKLKHERETIIPSGTRLLHHGSTTHLDHPDYPDYKIIEHHFTIHHQD